MESIWTATELLPSFPTLRGDHKTDVLIIGGGLAGLLCAYKLGKAGVRCAVAEADIIGSGATKNTTAKITAQHGLIYSQLLKKLGEEKARGYYAANQRALAEFKVKGVTSGIYVAEVSDRSAALKAGIEPGDVIVTLGGKPARSTAELQEAITSFSPGDEVTIEY